MITPGMSMFFSAVLMECSEYEIFSDSVFLHLANIY